MKMMLTSNAIMRLSWDTKVAFKDSRGNTVDFQINSTSKTLSLVAVPLAVGVADVAVVVELFKPF